MENVPREFGVDDLFWSQHPGRVFDVMGGGQGLGECFHDLLWSLDKTQVPLPDAFMRSAARSLN